MKLHLKIASIILNFSLAAYFVPSMFGSDTDDDCMFGFDDLPKRPDVNQGGKDVTAPGTMHKSALKLVTHEASSSHFTEDEDIFHFELTDETPPTQLVVPPNATSPYDTDNEEEESDDDTPYIEKIPASPHATVAKSNAIRIKPRSQSDDRTNVKRTTIQQRPRSESEPIYITGAKLKLSAKAENFSLGLHLLYEEFDYKNKAALKKYPLFCVLLEMSETLDIEELKLVLDSLPQKSHRTFALKTEVYTFLMANQKLL